MENAMTRVQQAVDDLDDALADFQMASADYEKLKAYYDGGQWRRDYEADEAGALPADCKRGVLSEDALYNLLTAYETLQKEGMQ